MTLFSDNDVPDEMELKTLLLGKPTKLESQFRLTFNMILNLLRQEGSRWMRPYIITQFFQI